LIAKGAMEGLSISSLCNHPEWRAFQIAPQEVEDEVKRLGGKIPKEKPAAKIGRWFGKLELIKFVGVVLVCLLVFPHLPGLEFDGTLINALLVTTAIYLVRYLFIAFSYCIVVPALLLAVQSFENVIKVIQENEGLVGIWLTVCSGFIYPALTIMLLSKVSPSLLTVTSWQGIFLAAASIWSLFVGFMWVYMKLVPYPDTSPVPEASEN
jgi:hypothetical protein